MATNKNVALIPVDYPMRTRLKIFAKAKVVELKGNAKLYNLLTVDDHKLKPQRMIVSHIEAYDWNCPQPSVPRYSIDEINEVLTPQNKYIITLKH